MNKVELYGRIANVPAIKEAGADGDFIKICNLTVAVTRIAKVGGTELTDFIPVVAFGKLAENTVGLMKKGDGVVVLGNIRVTNWKDKAGRTQSNIQIYAENIQLVCKSAKHKRLEKMKEDLPEEVQDFMQLKDGLDEELPFGS